MLSLDWALVILALCFTPSPALPDSDILGFDKVGHVGMFFVGALLWIRTWPSRGALVLAAGIALSVGTEAIQGLASSLGRSADPFDVVADLVGLFVGYGLVRWLRRDRQPAQA